MSDLISRQAAIDALARMMPRSYTPDGSHPADEEIFRAQEVFADCIEALEILPSAQPATNCSEIPNGSDNTISRQAAIDICRAPHMRNADCSDFEMAIMMLPPAPERKTGKWKIREDMYGDTEATCSECGFETVVDQPGNNLPMLSDLHFCPLCGAKMEGEQDGKR